MTPVRIAIAECDGIGPEIVASALAVARRALKVAGVDQVSWVEVELGRPAIEATGLALPESALALIEECDAVVLGPVDHATYPRHPDGRRQNPSGELRKRLDLFANVRPARAVPGVESLAPDMDLVIVRENTEGLYSDRNMFRGYGELMPTPDVALSVGVFTRAAVDRVVAHALQLAARRRNRLTVVHKANVLPETTGMYLEAADRLRGAYPGVEIDDEHVDAMAAALVKRPGDFDVVVTENLFGDVLSDLTAQLAGSLGMAGSLNAGAEVAMAQAAHGSAPDIAGQGVANPCSMVLSVAMLLEWLGSRRSSGALREAGAAIERAVDVALGQTRTRDLGGTAGTAEFTDAVLAAIEA